MDMLRLKGHALLAALLIACALASSSTAQPTPPGESYDYMAGGSQQPPQQDVQVSTTMIALLAGAVAVFVFIALSIIYLRHCTTGHYSASYAADRSALPAANVSTFLSRRWQLRQHQQRGTTRGLDKEVVDAFPTMRYAEAKALRVGKGQDQALECAVCLSEFEDEERLRLLPRCSHAFHPDCIGAWLAGHVTCPVCRCNLDPDKDPGSDDEPSLILPPPAAAEPNHSHSASSEIAAAAVVVRQHNDDDVAIDLAAASEEEEEAEQRRKEALELQRIGTQRRAMRSRSKKARQLLRSHSTGHDSLAATAAGRLGRDDMERFTLRLPEHVRREMMAASSWDQLSSTRRGQKSGDGVSSRRGAARLGLSGTGRWPSLFACTRTWSGRLPVFLPTRRTTEQSSDDGEVSSTSSSRIRGKRVAAVGVDYKATNRQVAVGLCSWNADPPYLPLNVKIISCRSSELIFACFLLEKNN